MLLPELNLKLSEQKKKKTKNIPCSVPAVTTYQNMQILKTKTTSNETESDIRLTQIEISNNKMLITVFGSCALRL